jgi:TonB family protein
MFRVTALGALFLCMGLSSMQVVAFAQSKPGAVPIASGFGKGAYPYGTVYPSIVSAKQPQYPSAAIAAGVEGEVRLEAVVGPEGTVTEIRVVKSLDSTYGLDASAIEAVRQWKFIAGTITGGQVVSAVVKARVVFYLHTPGATSGPPTTEAGLAGGDEVPSKSGGSPNGYDPATHSYDSSAPGITPPTMTSSPKPKYTQAAMQKNIQGIVELQVILGANGKVTSARVTKSLDAKYGLDDAAVAAAKKWTFTPCRLQGQAVPCRIELELGFKLH